MAASKTSERESSFNSDFEQFRWLEERYKISYEYSYLYAKSPFELDSYSSRTDQSHQQLDAYYQVKMNSRLTNSNQNVQF